MSTEREIKLRKLNAFRRNLPHVTGAALAAIMQEINENGLPDLLGRKQITEATHQKMSEVTPCGSMLISVKVVGQTSKQCRC